MIDAAEEHFQRDPLRRHLQSISDGITKIEQDGVEEPGNPEWQFDAIKRTRPEITQIEYAFQNVEGGLDQSGLVTDGLRLGHTKA